LGDVAARLDLVPTGVIYYFRNKEELAAACLMRAVAQFDGLIAAAEDEPTPEGRIDAFIEALFAFKADVEAGRASQIAAFSDLRALNNEAVSAAHASMFQRLQRWLAGPADVRLPSGNRNARAPLLMSEATWS